MEEGGETFGTQLRSPNHDKRGREGGMMELAEAAATQAEEAEEEEVEITGSGNARATIDLVCCLMLCYVI